MAAIDPNLLHAQWLQYQQSQLSKSAIIPQGIPQYAPQYAPNTPQGEFLDANTIDSIADFIKASNIAAVASAQYIAHLQSELNTMDREYLRLAEFSGIQESLIGKFLFDREFALDYIRGAWPREAITDEFMSRLAEVYLEIAALSPRGNDPQYKGNPNPRFEAQVTTAPNYQPIPPLPNGNSGNGGAITLDQYLAAQQQGQVGAARAAAMANPANLYASLFQ
jgi:hypothetical protein